MHLSQDPQIKKVAQHHVSLYSQVTREHRIKHRAQLENKEERMAYMLLQTWPSLGRESFFMEELAFVAFNGCKTVKEMQADVQTKLKLMKGLVPSFELQVQCVDKRKAPLCIKDSARLHAMCRHAYITFIPFSG